MTVIVLTTCPPGLRGFLTRWLLEISAGVFIGSPSARVRDILWSEVQQYAGQVAPCSPTPLTTNRASLSAPTTMLGIRSTTRA